MWFQTKNELKPKPSISTGGKKRIKDVISNKNNIKLNLIIFIY